MSASKVVVVESPAKAKTINKYLGSDYFVIASYGHIRDLPPKDGSVETDNDFAMSWEVDSKSKQHINDIANACNNASELILATDPDREGEAISWHIQDELKKRKKIKNINVSRVVFHEITKTAVLNAMKNPRNLDQDLIDAYLARRALDYLVGFTLSPVLWRKLPGAKSAGRVQSVALRLICEREAQIEIFKNREYWSVETNMLTINDHPFNARLTYLNGKKLSKFDLNNETSAKDAVAMVENSKFSIKNIERKTISRNPSPPFTTSTLQQEASRKLSMGTSKTMQVAQKLYEGMNIGLGETVGLITYMRTDSTTLSNDALSSARTAISVYYGDQYLPDSPRIYKTKAKNAQEAHEAVRPTDLSRRPQDVAQYLDRDQLRLYELIWKRTLSSQMASAKLDQVAIDISDENTKVTLRSNGSVVKFDGFLKLYLEDKDDDDGKDDDQHKRLPNMEVGDKSQMIKSTANQHFTQPPPRYSEASLVKKMEELGIGRPSTYASILRVLQNREYVILDKRRFTPQDRGRLVTTFLSSFFEKYFDYDFTANLEEQLDHVSDGKLNWKQVLRDFWENFNDLAEKTKGLTGTEVRDRLDSDLGQHFFKADKDGNTEATRKCPSCDNGRLNLNFGRFGAFIACSNYPECKFTRELAKAVATAQGDGDGLAVIDEAEYPQKLGVDPNSGEDINLKKGPYGLYVQIGETPPKEKGKKAIKPKRASLLKGMDPEDMDVELALKLLSLPRHIGDHPESGELILAGVGRYGAYLKHGAAFTSLPPDDDILSIGMNRAVEVLAEAAAKGKGIPAKEIGKHPDDGEIITIQSGRFGPYVKHGKLNAPIGRGTLPDDVTLEMAVEYLKIRAEKLAAKKAMGKKSPAKKAKAKKATAKKSKSKKAAAKKPKPKKT